MSFKAFVIVPVQEQWTRHSDWSLSRWQKMTNFLTSAANTVFSSSGVVVGQGKLSRRPAQESAAGDRFLVCDFYVLPLQLGDGALPGRGSFSFLPEWKPVLLTLDELRTFSEEEQERIRLLEAAVANLRQKAGVDLESTCNICFKTKFADGIGHICSQCGRRCCARCGVKVPLRLNKIWLCILCRKNKELAIKFGNWALKKEAGPQTQKSWGRSRSLEEEANTERQSPIPLLKRHFTSNLNIANTSLPFWNEEKKQQPAARPDPLPPPREDSSPQPHSLRGDSGSDGQVLQRRYTRRRSSLDTVRNDSLSSDQSENPPASRRPKPKRGNDHRYRRSGSSESEDEARSSPSSCQDSESDRVSMRKEKSSIRPHETRWRSQEDSQHITSVRKPPLCALYVRTGHRRHPCHVPEPRRPYADPHRHRRWDGGDGNTKDSGIDTSSSATLSEDTHKVSLDDEVLEWNGIRLRNLYKEEVAEIIGVTKNEPQVQLLVSRPCGINVPSPLDPIDGRRLPPPHMEIHPEAMQRDAPSSRYHDRHSSYPPSRNQVATIGGKIKVRVWYDPNDLQLVGTVERAIDLPPRPNQRPRTTYVRVSLLPDRGEKYRRRSKCIARSNDPQWNLSFVYSHLRQSELRNRTLQISVWDYEKNGSNDFLGEVLIPLRNLRSDSQWYNLSKHREEPKDNNPSPPVSPPASRMPSDEELSDYDEKFLEHTERRIMAVDSSPPFYEEERRRQSSVPFLAPAIMPPMMGERSRSMAAPSPTVEYSRGRMREPGYGDRRRSRSMADYTTRHMPSHGSRSVSPPQYRSEFQSLPRISSAHRLMPPQNSLRKRQLPLVPARNELEERYLRGRNSVSGSTSGTYGSEYDRFAVPRRGGGSRMAAALGVSATSPLISPDRSDSESSSKFNLSSAFHRNSRTFEEFRGRSSDYGGPVHPSSREMDGSLSDTAVGLMDKAKVNVHRAQEAPNLPAEEWILVLSCGAAERRDPAGCPGGQQHFVRRQHKRGQPDVSAPQSEILPLSVHL
ncbi:regulating synaptic membrane exocytosis protein 1 [Trichonephila inaurata madagascariensis]|uniref:Regulating synaptic membrane exocytosis protein 1 n=1 Tax=Trichonephila inaurata madagascariensis TaxID=2747483 RepID=A0A8X7CKU0_9ARAC|nr:regulating synaptic membrane exocytosis protein 1 [Trichonephila inaurata madagascariensis]